MSVSHISLVESGQMKMEDRKGYEDMEFNFQGKHRLQKVIK